MDSFSTVARLLKIICRAQHHQVSKQQIFVVIIIDFLDCTAVCAIMFILCALSYYTHSLFSSSPAE